MIFLNMIRSVIGRSALNGAPAYPREAGVFVPFGDLLGQTGGLLYECAGFDPATGNCAAFATYVLRAKRVHAEIVAHLPAGRYGTLIRIRDRAWIADGRLCSDGTELSVNVGPGGDVSLGSMIGRALRETIAVHGEVRSGYYRDGAGYIVQSEDAKGRPLPELSGIWVTFRDSHPGLRCVSC